MDKPWTNRGTPVYFHGTDVYCRGTAVFCRGLGYPEKREITGPKLWECLFEVEKGEKTTKWWCTKKRENKPSSPINRLCQNSCNINRLWKSRENIPSSLPVTSLTSHTLFFASQFSMPMCSRKTEVKMKITQQHQNHGIIAKGFPGPKVRCF